MCTKTLNSFTSYFAMKTHCTVKQGSSREFRLLIPLRTRPWPTRGLKTAGSRTPCFPDLLSRLLLNWNHGSVLECVSATLEKKVFNFRIYMYICVWIYIFAPAQASEAMILSIMNSHHACISIWPVVLEIVF